MRAAIEIELGKIKGLKLQYAEDPLTYFGWDLVKWFKLFGEAKQKKQQNMHYI